MEQITLYGYFRSSAAYRVRIALNLKGLGYQDAPLHLLGESGEQHQTAYAHINPQQLVPALRVEAEDSDDGGMLLTQSLAVIEYLDECYPEPPLLSGTPAHRAQTRALAQAICCDIHPLNNLRVLEYMKQTLHVCEDARSHWYHHWIAEGFTALEALLARQGQHHFCMGAQPTLADICLVPQVYNARRFNCALGDYPIIGKIYEHCMELEAFSQAAPENQVDAE